MKPLDKNKAKDASTINDIQNIKKSKKIEKNDLLVVSYVSEENINRSWIFFSDILKCEGYPSNIVVNYKLDKGKNTYTVGNEFSCYWIGISNIHYKCIESKNSYHIKKISWIIVLDIGFSIKKTYFIYPITSDDRTLIKLNLELISENNEPMQFEETKEYYYQLQYNIINKIIKVMEASKEYHFIHESFIVKKNQIICWNNIINLKKISEVTSGNIGYNFTCNGDPEKIGTFWKCELINEKNIIFVIIKNISKPKKRNTWVYCLETFGTHINVKQNVQINIIRIDNQTSQISILIKFLEKKTKNYYDYKKKRLKEVIPSIKTFINNL